MSWNKYNIIKIRKDLNPKVGDAIETIFIEIKTTVGKNIVVGVIYKPTNGRIEIFENAMNTIKNIPWENILNTVILTLQNLLTNFPKYTQQPMKHTYH